MKIPQYAFVLAAILSSFLLLAGCGSSAVAQSGDTVKVHYTGRLTDGTVFDTSVSDEPLEFTLGERRLISGFEQAVTGMQVGESKTVTIPVDQAYGARLDDLIIEVGRDEFPADINPEAGMQLQTSQGIITIVEVSETTVTVDFNHPLAGQDLTFDIELVEIGASRPEATESGLTAMPLARALTNGLPTVAEFGSSTCIPCKQMKPLLEELATEYKGKLNVVIVEIYEQRELAQQYEIMAIPTQIVFDHSGQEVTRHLGFWPREEIIAQLQEMGIE